MTERRDHGPGAPQTPSAAPVRTDAELDVRAIVTFGIGLAVLIAVVLAAVWLLSAGLKRGRAAFDPEPSPLAEANARRVPPQPRLQTAPVADMVTLRAQEDQVLTEYGPVDRTTGTARIPIDRAIEILARTGLPEPVARPGGTAAGATSGDGHGAAPGATPGPAPGATSGTAAPAHPGRAGR